MTISKKAWKDYITKLARVNAEAARAMGRYVNQFGFEDFDALIDAAYVIGQNYGEAASALACEMYDAIAAAEGVSVAAAIPADGVTRGELARIISLMDSKTAETVSAQVARYVKQAASDTMLRNAQRDGAEYAWVPSGDSCAFCIALASNGWKKVGKKSSTHAVHIHANCRCEYAVRFSKNSGVAGYEPKFYEQIYKSADPSKYMDGTHENAGKGWKAKINAIRREQYAENKDKNAQ